MAAATPLQKANRGEGSGIIGTRLFGLFAMNKQSLGTMVVPERNKRQMT
jgi:hypothetical protein